MCECDHRLLAMRFRIGRVGFRRQVRRGQNRYDVSRLSSVVSTTGDNRRTGKDEYQQKLAGLLDTSPEDTCEEQWNVLRSALTEAAAEVLGQRRRRKAIWYVEARDIIEPRLRERKSAYRRWIDEGRHDADFACYRNAIRTARNAVRECTNKWFVSLPEKIESQGLILHGCGRA